MLCAPASSASLAAVPRRPGVLRDPAPTARTARTSAARCPRRGPRMRPVACASSDADPGVARLLALGADAKEAASMAPFLANYLDSADNYYEAVGARVLRFCRVLGVSASNAFRFSSTQPSLCALDETALKKRAAALRAVLPACTRLPEVIGKAPTLLLIPASELAPALANLAFLPGALLGPLLEEEPTLLQPFSGPRRAEMRAVWQAGPFAALPASHVPADDNEAAELRRYAKDVLSSEFV